MRKSTKKPQRSRKRRPSKPLADGEEESPFEERDIEIGVPGNEKPDQVTAKPRKEAARRGPAPAI